LLTNEVKIDSIDHQLRKAIFMTDLINPDGKAQTDKFQRFIALNGGEFWRAKKDFEDRKISEGEVLMINQVDYVDNKSHTVHVRIHPSKVTEWKSVVKFLAQDFLNNFDFVEKNEADKIRDRELAAIQGRIKDAQDEMQEAFTDPKLLDDLVEKEMPKKEAEGSANLPVKLETFDADIIGAVKTQNLTALMSRGLTSQGVEQIKSGLEGQKDIAVRRSNWIQMRTRRLTKISAEMTPFFEEKAAIALAMTSDMRDHVDELMKGIGNLNLYVLKDVEIGNIKEGVSAPKEIKLSIPQRVLYMDEEMAVWEDVNDEFDSNDTDKFFEFLGESESLVNQMFPTERSIVSVAATRKHHQYEGYHPIEAARREVENKRQFLLVRDGSNIHYVLSPDIFHNFAKTLFPTTDATEAPFRGVDGSKISYNDLNYTRSLKEHERVALGYKRLLILLCGLDHNKQLFGEFYDGEPSLQFVTLEFQEKHFRFIHDVDGQGMLPSYRPENVHAWAKKMNDEISFGSRVIMQWRNVVDEVNFSGAFERENRWNSSYNNERGLQYSPTTRGSTLVGLVYRKGKDMVMDIEVSGNTVDYKERTFNAILNVSIALQDIRNFDILCVDRLNPKDANWYLHDRPSRNLNVSGIRMLKKAVKLSEEYRAEESDLRESLTNAMTSSGLFDDMEVVERLIDHAVAKWRCANPKKEIVGLESDKKSFNTLCDQIFFLGGKGRDPKAEILESEKSLGRTVIRLSLLANGKYVAYSSPIASEREDRVVSFNWIAKTTYSLLKSSVKPAKVTFEHLSKINNAETIIFELDDISPYLPPKNVPFNRPSDKKKAFDALSEGYALYQHISALKGNEDEVLDLISSFDDIRDNLTYHGKSTKGIISPYFHLPIGLTVKENEAFYIGLVGETGNLLAWLSQGNRTLENELIDIYSGIFRDKVKGIERIELIMGSVKGKSLHEIADIALYQVKKNVSGINLDPNNLVSRRNLKKADGHKYSIAKSIESLNVNGVESYLEMSSLENLDETLGIVKPDDWEPLIVLKNSDFGKGSKLSLFNYSPEIVSKLRGRVTVYDTFAEVEKAYSKTSYGTMGDEKHYSVELDWEEVDPVEVLGMTPKKSYEYKEVKRTEVDGFW
jgi:hypothetical protein